MSKTVSRAEPLVAVNAVSHLAIEASDLTRSISFYETVLGLDIFQDNRGDAHQPNIKGLIGGFGIELAQTKIASDRRMHPAKAGEQGCPCLSFSIADARSAFQRLKAAGHTHAEAITAFQGAQFFFVTDPDGYIFELIEFPGNLKTLSDLAPLLRGSECRFR